MTILDSLDTVLALCVASMPATRPETLWGAWSLAPEVTVPLVLVAGAYGRGLIVLAVDRRRGRIRAWQAACFAAGVAALAVALISPLCRMAATLAAAHMVQHAILVIVAPLLLLMASPGTVLGAALPAHCGRLWESRIWRPARWLSTPLVSSIAYGAAIWLWHIPAFYEAALRDEIVHLTSYATLVAAGLLFWHSQIATARRGLTGHGAAAIASAATAMHTGLLGALLTFAQQPWYDVLAGKSLLWQLSALEDQQLAGLTMWVPMGLAYLAAASALFLMWLRAIDRPNAAPQGVMPLVSAGQLTVAAPRAK